MDRRMQTAENSQVTKVGNYNNLRRIQHPLLQRLSHSWR